MKKLDKDTVLEIYEKSGQIMYQATLSGDYKANNCEASKLIALYKKFEKDPILAWQCIPVLLKSQNVVIRSKAASYCLSLHKNIEEAEHILENIAKENNDIFGFNAKMTLKIWHDKGDLLVYPKQKSHRSEDDSRSTGDGSTGDGSMCH